MPGTTAFPTALDTSTFPDIDGAVDDMNAPPHDEQHNNAAAAILAVETKIGIDGSADTASIDYRLAMLERLKYCRDDLLATGGETSITLGAAVYSNSLEVFLDGSLLPSAAYSVSEPTVTLDTPATGGQQYTVRFMTLDASPAAAILGIVYDSDAATFFTAASITDAGQKAAVSALVVDLKAAGVWAKCLAIYPMVGGTSSSHAVNLKSPGTYDITWSGTVTHSANGAVSNGSTGYGDTGLQANTAIGAPYGDDDSHLSFYSRTDLGSGFNGYDIGAWTGTQFIAIESGGYVCTNSNDYAAIAPASPTSTDAMYVGSRTSSTAVACYRNSSVGTNGPEATNGTSLPGYNIYLMALNASGTANYFSTRQLAFASIGRGLTGTQCTDLYAAVQTYQTALGRQV